MKLIILLLVCLSAIGKINAQEKPVTTKSLPKEILTKNVVPKDALPKIDYTKVGKLPTTDKPDWIELHEFRNYTGKVAKYAGNVTPFYYPFPNNQTLAFKVAPGYIAYIKYKENSQEEIITGNSEHSGFSGSEITGIRVVKADSARVNLSGLSYEIHNNDCKRVSATVLVKVYEKLDDGTMLPCPLVNENGIVLDWGKSIGREKYGAYILVSSPISPSTNIRNVDNLVFASNASSIPTIRSFPTSTMSNLGAKFLVSASAMQQSKIFVEVEPYFKIAHKSGDFFSDFTDDVTTRTTEKDLINYLLAENYFYTKVFQAKGNPINNFVVASGVEYSIIKNVRVHLNKIPR